MRELEEKAQFIRRQTLEMIVRAGKGHIGGSLSCVDILVALYYKVLQPEDKFILSKGHACAPLYAILADKGYFHETDLILSFRELISPCSRLGSTFLIEELLRFNQENGLLEGHPHIKIPGIVATTGSLGNGLGIGAGMAMTQSGRVFVLMGDGECQEGSVWEAIMFAGHHKLGNLIGIIDHNYYGSIDSTGNSVQLSPLDAKLRAFNWAVREILGHNLEQLLETLQPQGGSFPTMIIAKTIKGRGISFMENKVEWHHKVPNAKELEKARRELK